MHNKEKNLSNAKTASDPNLTFDYNELLDELTQDFGYEERLPGDIDVFMLMRATGKGENSCRKLLKRKAADGALIAVKVAGDHGMPIMVYRKAK